MTRRQRNLEAAKAKLKNAKLEISMPYTSGVDEEVMARDRAYFEEHPEEDRYAREYVPGEFTVILDGTPDFIQVCQVAPGVRSRQPIYIPNPFA
jgi:hypothetical protein